MSTHDAASYAHMGAGIEDTAGRSIDFQGSLIYLADFDRFDGAVE